MFFSLDCPLRIIVIGDPNSPWELHELFGNFWLVVEENLSDCPHLPSIIISPSSGNKFRISDFSLNELPNFKTSISWLSGIELPSSICWVELLFLFFIFLLKLGISGKALWWILFHKPIVVK